MRGLALVVCAACGGHGTAVDAAAGGDSTGSACNAGPMITGTVDSITFGAITRTSWTTCTEYMANNGLVSDGVHTLSFRRSQAQGSVEFYLDDTTHTIDMTSTGTVNAGAGCPNVSFHADFGANGAYDGSYEHP